MAFNWQTFRTRTLTAIIFVAIMLAGLLWNQWSFLILFSIIHFGCWWEYLKLVEKINAIRIDIAIKILLMLSGYILFLNIGIRWIHFDFFIGKGEVMISLKWLFFIFLSGLLLVYLFQNKVIPVKAKWMTVAGFAYISLSLGLMMDLYNGVEIHLHDSFNIFAIGIIPLTVIVAIWINDTMAYLIGSLIGKTPLSKVSPKKTWEGTIGGIIFCVALMYFLWGRLAYDIHDENMNLIFGIIAAIAATAGVFGDLLESKLKRAANVKDTGTLMPGHGGFLDRFDSLLLATPFVWLYVQLFIQ